ncbi:MAG TPA: hypothetical protein VIL30_13565 [Ramlibacter sp.]
MRARQWRLPLVLMFLVALVAGQALGLLHGVVHMEGGARHAQHQQPTAERIGGGVASANWVAGLFDNHAAGSGECLLAGHGLSPDLLAAPAAVLPQVVALAPDTPPPQRVLALAASKYFSARAPPTHG